MRKHLAVTLMAIVVMGVLTGCVFNPPGVPPIPPLPLPPPDTPHNAMLRFVETYKQKKTQEYQDMFTTDFTYEFSNGTDADLVAKYSTGWFKNDETESSSHLFQGYTPPGENYRPAASTISVDLTTTFPVDDNAPGVDPVTHKVNPTRVDGQIAIPPAPPTTTETTNYLIENNYNAFYLVRGDQASLTTSQAADSSHWYIYRWVDLTQPAAVTSGPIRTASTASTTSSPPIVRTTTWARVKDASR